MQDVYKIFKTSLGIKMLTWSRGEVYCKKEKQQHHTEQKKKNTKEPQEDLKDRTTACFSWSPKKPEPSGFNEIWQHEQCVEKEQANSKTTRNKKGKNQNTKDIKEKDQKNKTQTVGSENTRRKRAN